MPRRLHSARDHLDAIVALVAHALARRGVPAGDLVQHDADLLQLGDDLEAALAIARARGLDLPIDRLRAAFQLEPAETWCLYIALAAAVSSDIRTSLARPDGSVTFEVLDELVYSTAAVREQLAEHLARDGRLFLFGLFEDAAGGAHRAVLGQPIAIAERVVELAYGRDRIPADLARACTLRAPAELDLLLPEALTRAATAALHRHVETGGGAIPIARGPEGSGRRSLFECAARELGCGLLVVACERLPHDRFERTLVAIKREAVYARAAIVFANTDRLAADAETGAIDRRPALAAAVAHYAGPVAFTSASDDRAALDRGIVAIDLPALTEFDAATLWARSVPPALALEASQRYRLTGGGILAAARALADVRGGDADREITLEDVQAAVRAIGDAGLSTLGVRITWSQRWEDLVLPPESLDELRELIARVRHRRLVLEEWGFGKKIAKGFGVGALFSGPPGTGKTMAAGLVARELGLDLYQIDLSRMVSKYVGETEKNLAKVFEAAEAGHAILLFDEADSLFSKRTEVKSSVDRYANLEVNYLLQRLEQFDGITILTTNFDSAIDEAFRRRLAFRVYFGLPEVDERARLWQAVIPAAALGETIDFAMLASRFAMSGGYIKNAALRAAYLAAGEAKRIEMVHLLRAATSEYASMGKVMTSNGRL